MHHLSLDDRVLWEDGSITVPSASVINYIDIAKTGKLFTDVITPDIAEFNLLYGTEQQIKVKTELNPLSLDWILPDDIMRIDIPSLLDEKLDTELLRRKFNYHEMLLRMERIEYEYAAFVDNNLIDLIYAILHVINRFESNNIVWGVGRGSSTSSYLLYILGIHDIDSVEYDLDFTEFLH